jgi:predicted Zn-dependent peptidase
VAAERAIVLQEMSAGHAPAEDALLERAIGRAWPRHPMGWPLLGDPRVIAAATAASLRTYLAEVLHGNRLLVVACGAVNPEELQAACHALGRLPRGEEPGGTKPAFYPQRFNAYWEGEQAYCGWLLPVPPPRAALYPAALLANQVLGGGMSSRLYHQVRETLGLSYGVTARLELYGDMGLWWIGAACDPALADQCRRAVEKTMQQLLREGPTARELEEARQHLLANLYLEEDNPLRSMERLARETLYLGRNPGVADYQCWLESVGADQVRQLAGTALRQVMRIVWTPAAGGGVLKPPIPGFPSTPR